ncbi:hypothetical protein ACFQU2_18255 [Siccirubricoccus deserti]
MVSSKVRPSARARSGGSGDVATHTGAVLDHRHADAGTRRSGGKEAGDPVDRGARREGDEEACDVGLLRIQRARGSGPGHRRGGDQGTAGMMRMACSSGRPGRSSTAPPAPV